MEPVATESIPIHRGDDQPVGKRRSASVITDLKLAILRRCSISSTTIRHPHPWMVRFGNPGVPPDRGFLLFAITVRDAEAG
jgi:hypothetical protein